MSSLVDVAGYSREDKISTEACFYVVNNLTVHLDLFS